MRSQIGFFFVVLMPLACGRGPADWATSRGSAIYENGHAGWIDLETADLLQTELLAALDWGEHAERCIGEAIYFLHEWPIGICPGQPRGCFGFEEGELLHIGAAPSVPNDPGPRRSPWKHETIHWLQLCVFNIVDANHTRPEWRFQ